MMAEDEDVRGARFQCPKPVMILCLVYGVVLGLHYSMLVAKPLYVTEDLVMGRSKGLFLSHFPAGVRLMGGIIAAILADSYFGKFKVMASSYCLVFIIPGPLAILSTFHNLFDLKSRIIIYIASVTTDLLVGYGSVVHPAFIAEQFKMPQQELTLQTYYMFDYFYYNLCIAVLEFISLEYTFELSCFDGPKCYQIVFISYYVTYGIATFLFVAMKKFYIIRLPERSVIKDAISCIWTALKNKRRMRGQITNQNNKKHWLDWADCFDQQWRDDLRRIGKMLTMLFPYFVYYFLYAQMNSMWIYQASRLDGRLLDSWTMKPSQVEALNPIVIIIIAPIVEFILYPVFEKIKFLHTPLQRIGLAYLLTISAFIMAAVLQIHIDKHGSPIFTMDKAQFRIFNGLINTVEISSEWISGKLKPYSVGQALALDAKDEINRQLMVTYPNGTQWKGNVVAYEGVGSNYIITEDGVKKLKNNVDSSLLVSLRPSMLVVCAEKCIGNFYIKYNHFTTPIYNLKQLNSSSFTITLRYAAQSKFYINKRLIREFYIGDGGLYGVVIFRHLGHFDLKINTLLKPNSISIIWIFPQYITITISEIFLYVSTNMFVYTQSPPSMRSVVRGLFTAGNSLAQITLGAISLIRVPEVIWFFSLSAVLVLATIIHVIMARRYKYQEAHD